MKEKKFKNYSDARSFYDSLKGVAYRSILFKNNMWVVSWFDFGEMMEEMKGWF